MKTKSLLLILTLLSTTSLFSQVPSYVPTNGLVGWWPFNGNANDESGNGNNGTVNGPTLDFDRTGQPNSSYYFNNNHIQLPETFGFTCPNGEYTISLWFYSSFTGNPQQYFLDMRFGNSRRIVLDKFNGLDFNMEGTCGDAINGPAITGYSNSWTNMVGVYRNDSMLIYLNGIKVASKVNNYPCATPLTFSSGVCNGCGNEIYRTIGGTDNLYPNQFTIGNLDDIGIWNRALTQQEITTLYQSNTCTVPAYVPTNGLVGYWPFCGNANDVSGNGNNGTVNGATLTIDRFGNVNSAYEFDGSSNYINIPHSTSLAVQNAITVSCWIQPDSANIGTTRTIISKGLQSVYWNYGVSLSDSSFPIYNTTTFSAGIFSPIQLGIWHQLVFSISEPSNSMIIYVNGVSLDTVYNINTGQIISNFIGFIDPCCSQELNFGKNSGGQAYYNGNIDDIGIWNRALSALEIQQLYNSTPCTKPEPVTLGTDRSTKLCPNEAVTIEIVTPSTSGLSYEWTRNGTTMSGATASSINVADAAKYKVFVRSGPGLDCQRVSGLIETTAAVPPTITATTPNGNAFCVGDSVLMSATGITPGYSYQWKRFGVPIAGATSANYYAKQTGNYRCEVSNAGGCINQSNLVSIVNGTTCRIMQDQSSDVNVYPNPAKNSFTVSFNDIGNETPSTIELRSLQGQIIENRKLNGLGDVQFNIGKLAPGLYMVRVMLESGDVVEKSVMVE